MVTMESLDREISGIRQMAKHGGRTDRDLAKVCGCSVSTIRSRNTQGQLPLLSFWAVAAMAELAGRRIVFEEKAT